MQNPGRLPPFQTLLRDCELQRDVRTGVFGLEPAFPPALSSPPFSSCPGSSVGQSNGFLNRRSRVRAAPGVPRCQSTRITFKRLRYYMTTDGHSRLPSGIRIACDQRMPRGEVVPFRQQSVCATPGQPFPDLFKAPIEINTFWHFPSSLRVASTAAGLQIEVSARPFRITDNV